jgi:RNA polymerase sigma factor
VAVNDELNLYGFRFFDLTDCSPKQERTRSECAKAIRCLLERPDLMGELTRTRKLPVQALAKGSGVSKKLIDRYRKFLVMATVVLSGDYPMLAEYLRFVRKEAQV